MYYEKTSTQTFYEFDVYGSWLTNLPDDTVGYLSFSNDEPTRYIGTNTGLLNLIEKKFSKATFGKSHQFSVPMYLGCICKRDGSVIYWINNSKPLP